MHDAGSKSARPHIILLYMSTCRLPVAEKLHGLALCHYRGVDTKRIKIKKTKLKCHVQILIHCWRPAHTSVTWKRKWNPKMAPYIFMEKNGIHIIDLHKTVIKIDEAAAAIKQIAKSGRRVLFVATKKQAKDIVAEKVAAIGMPYVTERWAGGMLTNFPHDTQSRQEDGDHRQDDRRRHIQQFLQAREASRSSVSVRNWRRTSAPSPT